MPPRLPSTTRILGNGKYEQYVCASCLFQITTRQAATRRQLRLKSTAAEATHRKHPNRPPRLLPRTRTQKSNEIVRRSYTNGSLASNTAINAPATVPPEYRELNRRLSALQEKASGYVDLSRLQLATRSLESDSPVVRVALLGLGSNGLKAARKLARVLLSDALGEEEAWERELLAEGDDGRSVLLKYGEVEEHASNNPLVRTLTVASPFLQRHRLEMLVTALNTPDTIPSTSDPASLKAAVLVPPLSMPNSTDGRVGFVRYPVHKAVVVAEGISGAVEYGRFERALSNDDLVNAAISVPLRPPGNAQSGKEEVTDNSVDIDLASHALELFRASNANGAEFSAEWQTSRLPQLSEWIAGSRDPSSRAGSTTTTQHLISSLLATASASVTAVETIESTHAASTTVSDSKRSALQTSISTWCGDAHRDLQTNLDTSFRTSNSWKRTAWWRLFWRIDDVTNSTIDILRHSWLTEAEQRLAFLSGRIYDAGLATEEQLRGPAPQLLGNDTAAALADSNHKKSPNETVAELNQVPSMLARMQRQSGINVLFNPPWPQTIHLSREYMIHTLVPNMHRKAQALLLTTLSTIGGSAALGAWFYAATAGIAVYESGAIVSLGLVWALRRLQKKWGQERDAFASTVREDARRVLGEVEGQLRRLVNDGGRASVRPEDARSWQEARVAIWECQEALQKFGDGG